MENQSEKLDHQVAGLPSLCLASSRIQFSVHTMLEVASFAARAGAAEPKAMISATCRPTRSAAKAGRRWYRPSAGHGRDDCKSSVRQVQRHKAPEPLENWHVLTKMFR